MIVDPRVRIHPVVAPERVERAVKLARSATGDGTDLRAGRTPIFSLIVRGQYFELGDRVEIHGKHLAVVSGIHGRNAIDLDIVRTRAQPIGTDISDVPRRSGIGRGNEARSERSQRRKIPSIDRDVADDLALDSVRALGTLSLHERGFGRDCDRLIGHTDF